MPLVDKRVLWMCVLVGSTVGGFAPEAWGGSPLGAASVLFGVIGGLAGVWIAVRLAG